MPCTTILVGKKASNNGSTMIARNDDGHFDEKKLVLVSPKEQGTKYKSKIGHLEIDLPEKAYSYTATPSVDLKNGIWAANGINEKNVCMTATETITSNPRVMGADPYVKYVEGKSKKDTIIGGIGEEDLVVLVLPYINTAREGVLRLGELLEKYGTYEPNGIAFSDKDEIWWLESIGGHHWIARRVKDDEYVIMPNQFGLDKFDFDDAYGKGLENLCSKDLKDFVLNNNLYTGYDLANFNPRLAFGSHDDSDHVYNTPRAWFMARYFNPRTYLWDGENADFTPESDDIPWSLVPEHRITMEDVKYILSTNYQGTSFDPYGKENINRGKYRTIGINRTGVMAILEVRNGVDEKIAPIEWICFASNAFNTVLPIYTNVLKMPKYVSNTTLHADLDNFYWASRMIGILADAHYSKCMIHVERYQKESMNEGRRLVNKYDKLYNETKNKEVLNEANEEICKAIKELTDKCLANVIRTSSECMKNSFARWDN